MPENWIEVFVRERRKKTKPNRNRAWQRGNMRKREGQDRKK